MKTSSNKIATLGSRLSGLYHLELLLALIAMLVLQSFLGSNTLVERMVFNLLNLLVVLSAIRSLSSSRKRLAIAMVVGLMSYGLSWITEYHDRAMLNATMLLGYVVVFAILLSALSESVFHSGPVDTNRIIGASCVYLVLGMLWALIYAVLETLQPGSFRFTNELASDAILQDKVSNLTYFSNVTLTTVGYGDIVPVCPPARMLAALEALVGQLYVAIIIGRMVGLHISDTH